jgi:hypothetical protein
MTPELLAGNLAATNAEKPPGPPPRPKLRRVERHPDPGRWRDVVPPALAEQVAGSDELEAHRKLVERVETATAKANDLLRAQQQAVAKDRQAEVDFATKGRKLPAPAGPDAEAAVGQARRELELVEQQLPASADRLFAAAYPHLEDALREVERQVEQDDSAVDAAISEALRVLDERADAAREAHWIGLAMWESSVAPFDARARRVASTKVAATLRQTIAELRHEREAAARRKLERMIELEVMFNPDRSPRRQDGRPAAVRRAEAEQRVRQRLEREATR